MNYTVDEALIILGNTPSTLRALLHNLPNSWIISNEGGKSWSPFDVVGHLVQGEKKDWILRSEIILSDAESKEFPPFDRFEQKETSKDKNIKNLLDEFETLRIQNLQKLKAFQLNSKKLDATGIHPEFGTVTLRQHLSTWVAHDLGHIAQISRVMAKQYKDECGPWTAYLPILNH